MKFVARATDHPQEDLNRNWSAVLGGVANEDFYVCESLEEAEAMWGKYYGFDKYEDAAETNPFRASDWGYHPLYEGWVQIHYLGLGAYRLEASNLDDAINEAVERFGDDVYGMAGIIDWGDGHFYASDCVGYHAAGLEGLWVFVIS